MSIGTNIKKLSNSVPIGCSAYFDCPNCGRKRKMGITKFVDKVMYQCFSASCGLKGVLQTSLNKASIARTLNKEPAIQQAFKSPDYLIAGFPIEDSVQFALKYDLLEPYNKGWFKTAYDPRLQRQVFFHLDDDGCVVGAMGRALSHSVKPKAHIYPNSEKTLFFCGQEKVAVLVEDILSAIKLSNHGVTGVALSGTTLSMNYIKQLSKFKKIIVALDKDATIKSFQLKKLLDFYCQSVVLLPLQKDFKDTPNPEITKILKEVLS